MNNSISLLFNNPKVLGAVEVTNNVNGFCRSRIYTINIGINPLVAACDPILSLVSNLNNIDYPHDREKFLQDLSHEINAFEYRAHMANYPPSIIIAARYVLCCLLDERIAYTSSWGRDGGWLQNNLLTTFHNEGYGGMNFFTIVNHVLEDANKNIHLIELLYICLKLGFEGEYRKQEDGKDKLLSIVNHLYQVIIKYNKMVHNKTAFGVENNLVAGEENKIEQTQFYKLFKNQKSWNKKMFCIAATIAIVISFFIFFSVYIKLHSISKPVYSIIEHNINMFKQSTTFGYK